MSIQQLRAVKFDHYSRYFISSSTVATVFEVLLFISISSSDGALDSSVVEGMLIAGTAVISTVAITIALAFITYGTLTGLHMINKSPQPKIGRRMIGVAWTLGLALLTEATLWLASVSVNLSAVSEQEEILGLSYFLSLIAMGAVSQLYENTIRVLKSRSLGSRTSTGKSKRTRSTGSKHSQRSSKPTKGSRAPSSHTYRSKKETSSFSKSNWVNSQRKQHSKNEEIKMIKINNSTIGSQPASRYSSMRNVESKLVSFRQSGQDQSEGLWKEARAEDGTIYWINSITKESRWTKPDDHTIDILDVQVDSVTVNSNTPKNLRL